MLTVIEVLAVVVLLIVAGVVVIRRSTARPARGMAKARELEAVDSHGGAPDRP